jgi:hypothetical protein
MERKYKYMVKWAPMNLIPSATFCTIDTLSSHDRTDPTRRVDPWTRKLEIEFGQGFIKDHHGSHSLPGLSFWGSIKDSTSLESHLVN